LPPQLWALHQLLSKDKVMFALGLLLPSVMLQLLLFHQHLVL